MMSVRFRRLHKSRRRSQTLGVDRRRYGHGLGFPPSLLLIIFFGCASLNAAVSAEAAGLHGEAELLRLAAVEQQANLGKLRTWSAKVAIDTELKKGDVMFQSSSETVDFVYDHAKGTRWTWTDTAHKEDKPAAHDEPAPSRRGSTGLTLAKEGATYLRPALPFEELGQSQQVGIYPSGSGGISRDKFDPIYFYRLRQMDIVERFLFYYEAAKTDADMNHVFVERNGSLITLELRRPSAVNRYVVSLDHGCHIVRYLADERSKVVTATEEWTYEYARVGGVWVPKLITLEMASPDGPARKTTRTRWLTNEVNGATSPEEFSVQSLGTRVGERVQDTRTRAAYTFGDQESPGRAQSPRGSWWWLAILNILAVLIVLSAVVLARRRRAR